MYSVASIRLTVCPWVCLFVYLFVDIRGSALPSALKSNWSRYQLQGVFLCVCNQWAFADNRVDVVNWLLIYLDS